MDSDKNRNILEKQLKAIGKKVRLDILKKLSNSQVPLTYSVLQKEILGNNSNSTNFSFHLKTLKKNDLIENLEEGYTLTVLGRQILKNILSIEQILNVQNKSIMIRTSKYSKEPFDFRKIEEYLIKEGNMEKYQARQIAQEVEERLSKTSIEYLTAPLMREYINGILLENGLEKFRHNLTRLGTPPFEVKQYFTNSNLNPEAFIKILGTEISEQYLLLNLLPNKLADLYLSGDIYLLHLNYWSLRPLSLYISTSDLLEYNNKIIDLNSNLMELILHLSNKMREIKPYFSEDLLLGDFNSLLDIFNENHKVSKESYLMLISELFKFNSTYLDDRSHLSLDLSFKYKEFFHEILRILEKNEYHKFPNLMISYSDTKDDLETGFISLLNSKLQNSIRFYDKFESRLLNSTLNYVNAPSDYVSTTNKIILDKILINLHTIALQSHQNDDLFFDLVQERINEIFQIYLIKKKLIEKKLNGSKSWNQLITSFFNHKEKNWIDTSLKSISFFGLNKAIKVHCGIEIDRIEKSEKFALDVLTLIKDIIYEKNSEENESYFINQPHEGKYLYETWIKTHSLQDKSGPAYSMDLIRKESKLDIKKQLELFKKFESILDGGSLYNYYFKSNKDRLIETIEKLISSKVPAFSICFD